MLQGLKHHVYEFYVTHNTAHPLSSTTKDSTDEKIVDNHLTY
jgi:hypothetical protein